jgi:phage terminase large subunit GpA-like protein
MLQEALTTEQLLNPKWGMAGLPPVAWWPVEQSAWRPPEALTVSQWAEKHRILPESSAISGPWLNELVPYAVEPMDAYNDPYVERIILMACVQSAKTEIILNMKGFIFDQDPAPTMTVMPTLEGVKEANARTQEMLLASPTLSAHLTGDPDDLQKKKIRLDRMKEFYATAGSSADLRHRSVRNIFLDETDEYDPNTSDQGSPIKQAESRATTFANRKIVILCTPTIPEGYINQEYKCSDQRKFWVPCPHCGGYQILLFKQVKHKGEKLGKWPQEKRAPEYIKLEKAACYECKYCQAEIYETDKPEMLRRGKWVPAEHPIQRDGFMLPPPPTSIRGYWWNALYSPFRTFSEMAAEFFESQGDREKLKTFTNLWLAEPWKEIIKQQPPAAILKLRTARQELEVPDGALALTAGIDNQKVGCWVSIWAWVRLESGLIDQHLIRYGYLADFTELGIWLFQDVYSTADGRLTYPVWRGGLDTGGGEGAEGDAGMTEQVYQWLRLFGQGRIFGIKGSSRPLTAGKKMVESRIDKMPGGKPIPQGLRLWILDTDALKDAFWSRVETGRVHLHAGTEELFAAHLSAEAKERDNRGRLKWVQQGSKPNHLLDTAIYATAMADPECWGGVKVLPTPVKPASQPDRERAKINTFTGRPEGSFLD